MWLHLWCRVLDVTTAPRQCYRHWLRRRVDFKMATLVYLSLSGMAPAYLSADCQLISDEECALGDEPTGYSNYSLYGDICSYRSEAECGTAL